MNEKYVHWLQGAAGGAIALAIVGFSWGGWVTDRTAKELARKESNVAVVKALTPLCIANFQKSADAQVKLVELKKISSTWARETYVKEGKWATIGTEQNGGVVDACAEALFKL